MNPEYKERIKEVKVGDIWLMRFDGEDSEQKGVRPGVIFQNNIGNSNSPNTIALPLSSSVKKTHQPTHVLLRSGRYGLDRDSIVLCENPQRMSKRRMIKPIARLDREAMKDIALGNLLSSGAISFLTEEELLSAWRKAKKLNSTASL